MSGKDSATPVRHGDPRLERFAQTVWDAIDGLDGDLPAASVIGVLDLVRHELIRSTMDTE